MNLTVSHRTVYAFDAARRSLIQSLRLWPSDFTGQSVLDWTIDVDGGEMQRGAQFRDGAGDQIETIAFKSGLREAAITVRGTVATTDQSGVVRGLRDRVPPLAYLRPGNMTRLDQGLRDVAGDAIAGIDDPLERAHALARAITRSITYLSGSTVAQTTAAEALAQGSGVCQDQTHALIAVARAVDMPGRYVTGYLHTDATGNVHEASHAWAELWVEGLGWVGFDAANACCPDERYIRVGSGLDSVDAAPIRGVSVGPGQETLTVELSVEAAAQQ